MAVNWEELKTASAAMLKNAAQAVRDIPELQTTVTEAAAKAPGADKTAWEGAGTELATLLAEATKAKDASQELDTIAAGKKDDKAGDAETQRQAAQTAAETAIRISEGVLTKLKGITGAADAREDVEALATPLKVVKTQAETKAKPALGATSTPAPTPAPSTTVTPGTTPATPTPPAAVPPGTTPAEKAVAAATEAETAATTAEAEAKNIDKATDLVAAKAVATKAADAAKIAKDKAGEAATEANKAATGTAKTAWEEAVGAANAAKTAAETAEADAKGIATAADLAAAKAAAPKVVTAATAAKGKATTARQNADKAKSLGASETSKTPETPKKTPGAFGMSVTAAYSKKFSLETKMHSEIKVTMVPYPPPALFLDWIRDHFEQVKKEREKNENSVG